MKRSAETCWALVVVLLGAARAGIAQGTGTGTPPTAPGTTPESSGKPVEQAPAPDTTPPPATTPTPAPRRPSKFEANGYIRSTFANTDNGDNAKPFQLPGAPTKYRLGNEPEHYGEFTFTGNHNLQNGMTLGVVTMIGVNGEVNNLPYLADIDRSPNSRFAQLFLQAGNIAALGGARVWAGRIYYRRTDIHISDFFYWNPSGDGLGIENVKLGGQSYSYAYFRNNGVNTPHTADRHDFQVGEITTNPNGELRLGLSLVQGRGGGAHDGYSITAQHRQERVAGGATRLVLQYGVGPGSGYAGLAAQTGDLSLGSRSRSFRVIPSLRWQNAAHNFNGMLLGVYQRNRNTSDGVREWTSLGARPVYAFTDHLKLAVEIGQDRINPYAGDARTLTKITVAPILSQGWAFFNRPELRLFYTYARWNRAAQSAAATGGALSTTGPYGSDRDGSTYGVQLEHWW